MKSSAASLYQIDERGLELRRTYMGMTAAERELLGGMQAWADRNADAIGAKLAEHTFSHAASGQFLTRLRERARAFASPTSRRAGAPPRPATSRRSSPRPPSPERLRRRLLRGPAGRRRAAQQDQPAAEVVPGHVSRVPRPRPRRDARRRAGARPGHQAHAAAAAPRASTSTVINAAERAISRVFNYDSQAIVEAFYYDTFSSMGVNLKVDGRGRPGPRHLRHVRDRPQRHARDAEELRRLDGRRAGDVREHEPLARARPARRSTSSR